ncbi:MAG: DNA replication/repair protein RecF [Gammaproteobacteria bacterium]|nr:DNA replication/repair protein RecF [Gammaproteobacteria bacterium]
MAISRLDIYNVRNIKQQRIELGQGLNLIWGENGSGKTSIIEAVHILASGKSFRTNQVISAVTRGQDVLTVSANVDSEKDGGETLGISRGEKIVEARISGQKVRTFSELARRLPVTVITPESHRLLEGGPNWRRRFLDWGLFHVKPEYAQQWSKFSQILKQRNRALQRPDSSNSIEIWTEQLIVAAQDVDKARKSYFEDLKPKLEEFCTYFLPEREIRFSYYQGWPDKPFSIAVKTSLDRDRNFQRTEYGPHRGDIRLKFDGSSAKDAVSRGQQKLLVYALELAQIDYLNKSIGKNSVLLLDDLGAELDAAKIESVLSKVNMEFNQVIITATSRDQIPLDSFSAKKLFHVKQGVILND